MTTRKRLPIGPLALAMRLRRGENGTTGNGITIAAVIAGLALAAGLILLMLNT